jgi:hypothetical protein
MMTNPDDRVGRDVLVSAKRLHIISEILAAGVRRRSAAGRRRAVS